jgi:hypothetical protein
MDTVQALDLTCIGISKESLQIAQILRPVVLLVNTVTGPIALVAHQTLGLEMVSWGGKPRVCATSGILERWSKWIGRAA